MKKLMAKYACHQDPKIDQMSSLVDHFLSKAQGGMGNWTDFSYASLDSECKSEESEVVTSQMLNDKHRFTRFDIQKGTFDDNVKLDQIMQEGQKRMHQKRGNAVKR